MEKEIKAQPDTCPLCDVTGKNGNWGFSPEGWENVRENHRRNHTKNHCETCSCI